VEGNEYRVESKPEKDLNGAGLGRWIGEDSVALL
jgi:hypothetical protein